ncbi:hypothetical protein CEXT_448311 [Caerostris extrusa]|uniref:Uncharacterized protein n=1 Tax=Caerostris extrusa TaxID=172846 RepID=A0AAV4XHM4_CAEEX|nr:hypothetical protein CEXT_448311 [Caerostris extrusa]
MNRKVNTSHPFTPCSTPSAMYLARFARTSGWINIENERTRYAIYETRYKSLQFGISTVPIIHLSPISVVKVRGEVLGIKFMDVIDIANGEKTE